MGLPDKYYERHESRQDVILLYSFHRKGSPWFRSSDFMKYGSQQLSSRHEYIQSTARCAKSLEHPQSSLTPGMLLPSKVQPDLYRKTVSPQAEIVKSFLAPGRGFAIAGA